MSIEASLSKIGKILDRMFFNLKKTFIAVFEWGENTNNQKSAHYRHSSMTSSYFVLAFDAFLAFLSLFISIHLRIGMDFLDYSPAYILKNMLVFSLVSTSIFLWLQTYQAFWRYTTIEDMPPIFLSVILANLLFFPLMMLMNQGDFFPYSVLIINVFVFSISLMIPRFLCKIVYNQKLSKIQKFDAIVRNKSQTTYIPRVLLIGNVESVEAFSREVISNDDVSFNLNPIGILTLEQADIGRTIKGVPILGELRDIDKVMQTLSKEGVAPEQLVIAEKQLSDKAKKFVIRYAQKSNVLLLHAIFQFSFCKVAE